MHRLANEGALEIDAMCDDAFAGKPAPTGHRAVTEFRALRRSWLASEGVREIDAMFDDAFASKPAPTGHRAVTEFGALRRSWLASEGGARDWRNV